MISTIRCALPLFSLIAIYAIIGFSSHNGLFFLIQDSIANKTLPGSDKPLRTSYTGIRYLDHVLTNLGPFFWPAITGDSPSMSVYLLGFLGSFGAAWVLLTLEGWRRGNTGKVVALQVFLRIECHDWSGVHCVLGLTSRQPIYLRHPCANNHLRCYCSCLLYLAALHIQNRH
ncbi:hypothetical protein VTN77DRAFT_9617 [Rasamsonia byssochlamydoides]|uniref:uncharacterized protein n=1 Tax=Rasamsonia byssochlamydoides TaxID=89139 RepID=UPI003743DB06